MKTLVAGLFLSLSFHVTADELTGRVIDVHDGDTITILDDQHNKHRIRLFGIDAPELNQPYGQASRKALEQKTGQNYCASSQG